MLPFRPQFQHLYAGLTALADWIGSDNRLCQYPAALPGGLRRTKSFCSTACARTGRAVRTGSVLSGQRRAHSRAHW